VAWAVLTEIVSLRERGRERRERITHRRRRKLEQLCRDLKAAGLDPQEDREYLEQARREAPQRRAPRLEVMPPSIMRVCITLVVGARLQLRGGFLAALSPLAQCAGPLSALPSWPRPLIYGDTSSVYQPKALLALS